MRKLLTSFAVVGLLTAGVAPAHARPGPAPDPATDHGRQVVSTQRSPLRSWVDNVPMRGGYVEATTLPGGSTVARTHTADERVDTAALRAMVDAGAHLPTIHDWERWGREDAEVDPVTGGPVGTGRLLTDELASRLVSRVTSGTTALHGTTTPRRRAKDQYVERIHCHAANVGEGGDVSIRNCAFQQKPKRKKWFRQNGRLHIPVRQWGYGFSNPTGDSSIVAVGGLSWPTIGKHADAADFSPKSAKHVGSCDSVTFGAQYKGVSFGYTREVCPQKIQFWNDGQGADRRFNGAVWTTTERTRDPRQAHWTAVLDWKPLRPRRYSNTLRFETNAKVRYYN